MVRAPDSRSKGRGFESLHERRENFLFQGQLSVLTLFRYPFHPRVTAVARKRSRSFCQKCRWQVTTKTYMHLTYVTLHEVTRCMVVWCSQSAPRWLQFPVAPAMPALSVHHFGGYSTTTKARYKKLLTRVDIESHANAVSLF